MINKNIKLSIAMGIALVNGVFASTPNKDIEIFDINSIEYIEEEAEITLGFDVEDYLPEGFDPYKMYVDLNAIEFIEEEVEISDFSENLPSDFDAYAFPNDVESINYIDEDDSFLPNINAKKYLPEGFNAYTK